MICFLIGLACVSAVVLGIPFVMYVIGIAATKIARDGVPAKEIGYHVSIGGLWTVAGIVIWGLCLFIHWLGCVIHG